MPIDVFEEIVLWLQGMENVFKDANPEESKEPSADFKPSREPMWHRISGEALKVTFDYKIEEEEDEEEPKEDSKDGITEYLRIAAEVLKADDRLHCVDFQLKKYLVKKPSADGKELEEIELDITFDAREKFVDFMHNTLFASKFIKDYVDASEKDVVSTH